MTNQNFIYRFSEILCIFYFCVFTNNAMANPVIEGKWWLLDAEYVADFQKPFHVSDLIKLENGILFSEHVGYVSGVSPDDTSTYLWINSDEIQFTSGYRIKFHLRSSDILEVMFENETVVYYNIDSYKYYGVLDEELFYEQLTHSFWQEEINPKQKLFFFNELVFQGNKEEHLMWKAMLVVKFERSKNFNELFLKSFQKKWAMKIIGGTVFIKFTESTNISEIYEFKMPSSNSMLEEMKQERIFIIQQLENDRLVLIAPNIGNNIAKFVLNSSK